ncbi:hypothetical protein KC952_01020 [Candidatus Saccharibacteria bacterium]|nr:hypothetical protein [Candidatus Saccharibacteria bacterium]
MAGQQGTALRKRQKIKQAGRMMFFWVAGASVIVGASAVVLFSMTQKLIFNEQVLAKKGQTISRLEQNKKIVPELKDNVRLLNTNQKLINLQTPADAQPVQVIFDALPTTANGEALGSALSHPKLLGDSSITVISSSVGDSSIDSASSSSSSSSSTSATSGTNSGTTSSTSSTTVKPSEISFRFTVSSSSVNNLRDLLSRMSRSIRAFNVSSVNFMNSTKNFEMTVTGQAYYLPAKTVDTTTVQVPEKKKVSSVRRASSEKK